MAATIHTSEWNATRQSKNKDDTKAMLTVKLE
jgi:hypothetical protein